MRGATNEGLRLQDAGEEIVTTPLISVSDLPPLPCHPDTLSPYVSQVGAGASLDSYLDNWGQLEIWYDTPDTEDTRQKLEPVKSLRSELTAAFTKLSSALTTYHGELVILEKERDTLYTDVTEFRGRAFAWADEWREDPQYADYSVEELLDEVGRHEKWTNSDLHSQCLALGRKITSAGQALSRDIADVQGPATWLPEGSVDAPKQVDASDVVKAAQSGVTNRILDALVKAAGEPPSEEALAAFLRDNPKFAEDLANADAPEAVRDWWADIRLPENAELYAALILGAPTIFGNLGGIPPMDRVEINRITAAQKLEQSKRELEGYPLYNDAGGPWPAPQSLYDEIAYLEAVLAGDRQLYAYDPWNDRIVEMIGDPTTATTTIMYLPGTTINFEKFWSLEAQQVAEWLVTEDADRGISSVAFVYMDGPGPTWPLMSWSHTNIDPQYAANAGAQIDSFNDALYVAEPGLGDAYKVGAGHSAGETALSASELSGSHYDYHASLAGAWQLPDWQADPNTTYGHYTYGYDLLNLLSKEQGTKAIPVAGSWISGLGLTDLFYQMPLDSDDFNQFNLQGTGWVLSNHNQAADGPDSNLAILEALRAEINAGREVEGE